MSLIERYNLKIGDPVLFIHAKDRIEGMIGEIIGCIIYLWHNNPNYIGDAGTITPNNYKYSWSFSKYNNSILIELLDDADSLNKKSLKRIAKKNESNRKT